jgi:hypothetical protein
MAEGDPSQVLDGPHPADRFPHEREEAARTGVEQEWLVAVDEDWLNMKSASGT